MRALCLILVLGLAGCAVQPVVKPVVSGGNRADGIVTMSSNASLFQPVRPNWSEAEATAARQCGRWGYDGPHRFAGDRDACQAYDWYGHCIRSVVTRFYDCGA